MRNLFFGTLILLATSASAQRDFAGVQIKVIPVAGSVYMLEGAGGNIGVSVGDDGIVLIDDQFAPLVPKIEAALRSITERPVRFVINTHYHGDHTGGNEALGKSAPVIAHDNVRKRLASGTTALGEKTPPAPPAALPVLTFNDTMTVHLNGEEVRAVHFPSGHTDGDSVIWFTRSNVVHMGDDFFNGVFPYVDLDNGGSVRGLIASLDRVVETLPDDVKVIPGHGPLSDKSGLRRFVAMLRATTGIVENGIASGRTLEQLKADRVLAAWESWGSGFVKTDFWIDTLYRELK